MHWGLHAHCGQDACAAVHASGHADFDHDDDHDGGADPYQSPSDDGDDSECELCAVISALQTDLLDASAQTGHSLLELDSRPAPERVTVSSLANAALSARPPPTTLG